MNWFEVDKKGLRAIVERTGYARAVYELIANSLDTDATEVIATLTRIQGTPFVTVTVSDNSSTGFEIIEEAWTLFAPSRKAGDIETRGKFNLGEKLALSLARSARIVSIGSAVEFTEDGRRRIRARTEAGTVVELEIRMTGDQLTEAIESLYRIIPPEGQTVTVNGRTLKASGLVGVTRVELPTEAANDEGVLRSRRRKTDVAVYPANESGWLYEMGMPVCENGTAWHADVQQVVPSSLDRTSTSTKYMTQVHGAILEVVAREGKLGKAEAAEPWVSQGIETTSDMNVVAAAVRRQFGDRAVVADPSDPEATKRAIEQGRTVIPPNAFSRKAWGNVREARESTGVARPAGQVFPSGVKTSPDGTPPISREEWTPQMRAMDRYVMAWVEILKVPVPYIKFYRVSGERALAWCSPGGGPVSFNLAKLTNRFVNEPDETQIIEILIHEFAHSNGADDHLSDQFHQNCTSLGARMATVDARPDLAGFYAEEEVEL